MGLLRNCTGDLATEKIGKAKLDAFFPWSLRVKPVFRNPGFPGPVRSLEQERLTLLPDLRNTWDWMWLPPQREKEL